MKGINKKIKGLRKEKGLTLQQLADLTDFSKGYLSRIETSVMSPRLPTLQKLARALEVDIGVFFEQSEERENHKHHLDLVSGMGDNRTETVESNAAYSYQPLVHNFGGKYMAPYLLRIAHSHTKRLTHDSEEMLYVISGVIRFLYNGSEYQLNPGENVYFDSRLEHQVINDGQEEAVLLNVVYDYRRF